MVRISLLSLIIFVLFVAAVSVGEAALAQAGADQPVTLAQAGADQPVTGPCNGQPAPPSGWILSKGGASADILRATQSQETYKGEVLSFRNWRNDPCGLPNQRTRVNLIANYDSKRGSKPPSTVTRVGDLRLQHLFFTSSDAMRYVSMNADGYHNTALAVYFQQAVGVGVGRVINRLELSADLRAIEQRFYNTKANTLAGVLLGVRHSLPVGTATIASMLELVPVFIKSHASQARSSLALAVPLNPSNPRGIWSLTVSVSDDYIQNVPSKFKPNYFKSSVGLQYSAK